MLTSPWWLRSNQHILHNTYRVRGLHTVITTSSKSARSWVFNPFPRSRTVWNGCPTPNPGTLSTGRAINGYTHLMAFVHPSPNVLNRSRSVLMGVHGVMYSAITMARVMLVAIPRNPPMRYHTSHLAVTVDSSLIRPQRASSKNTSCSTTYHHFVTPPGKSSKRWTRHRK